MKKFFIVSLAALLCGQTVALARQAPKPAGATPAPQQPRPVQPRLSLDDFGIQIAPDARLVVVMAALEAAGWDPTPKGEPPSVFRELVRKDQAGLDSTLRARMQDFYKRNALKDEQATPADQAARYVSLAYTLGPPPAFEAPPRSDDLPSGVLDVLDFVPLVREFYRQSGIEGRLTTYLNSHRAAGDGLRRSTDEMARFVLNYLSTRPETTVLERVQPAAPAQGDAKKKKDDKRPAPTFRERTRRFHVVPDLLAAPGAINFRIVGDDYFAVVPAGTDPRWTDVRRAYVQFVVDPLVLRFHKDISAKHAEIKLLLDGERARRSRDITPDIFLAVARSLVAAADARMDEVAHLYVLQQETAELLQRAGANQAGRDAVLKSSKERQEQIKDSTVAQLAEAYERGAVLSFHFADELKELEGSGFDVAAFISPMLADFSPARELKRPDEYAAAVARAGEARRKAREARAAASEATTERPQDPRRAALVKSLSDVDDLMRLKNYEEAETRLLALRDEYREEPRVYFALGQVSSLSAQEAFDETLQAQRLDRALQHFRQALLFASPDTDRAVILRARLASGRILAHLERTDEAAREFDAVIQSSNAADPIHQEALAAKKKLPGQK